MKPLLIIAFCAVAGGCGVVTDERVQSNGQPTSTHKATRPIPTTDTDMVDNVVFHNTIARTPTLDAPPTYDGGEAAPVSEVMDAETPDAGIETVVEVDTDHDGILDPDDNCLDYPNPRQDDWDEDGVGDSCDNCANSTNPDQVDVDADCTGDVCDDIILTPPDVDASSLPNWSIVMVVFSENTTNSGWSVYRPGQDCTDCSAPYTQFVTSPAKGDAIIMPTIASYTDADGLVCIMDENNPYILDYSYPENLMGQDAPSISVRFWVVWHHHVGNQKCSYTDQGGPNSTVGLSREVARVYWPHENGRQVGAMVVHRSNQTSTP